MIHVSQHALDRYRERVADIPDDAIRANLTSPFIQAAIDFGCHYVRLATGQRVVIQGQTITTVLPKDAPRRQMSRSRLP